MASTKYVVFRVAEEKFGLRIDVVERILAEQKTTRVPRTPAMVLGVFDMRGETISAVDMRTRFDLPATAAAGNFVVVLSGRDKIALRVDGVEGIWPFDDQEIETNCEFLRKKEDDFMSGVAKKDESLVVILDPDNVIPSQVKAKVRLAA